MAMNTLSLLLLLSLSIAASSLFGSSAAFGGRKALAPSSDVDIDVDAAAPAPFPADLGFTFLNSKDPKVLELAKFAIEEYNKSHKASLAMYSVMEAISTDKDGGIDYALVIATIKDQILTAYYSNVFVENNVKKLTSFEEQN